MFTFYRILLDNFRVEDEMFHELKYQFYFSIVQQFDEINCFIYLGIKMDTNDF